MWCDIQEVKYVCLNNTDKKNEIKSNMWDHTFF